MIKSRAFGKAIPWLALAVGLTSAAPAQALPVHGPFARAASTPKIDHVIVIVQDGRSFNDLFLGYPGATTSPTGKSSHGKTVRLRQQPLASSATLSATFPQAVTAIDYANGEAMDGFNPAAYQYVRRADVQTYWNIAQQYVLGDHFFASDLDGSFQGHQYLIAGQPKTTWGDPTNATIGVATAAPRDTVALLNPSTEARHADRRKKTAVCFDPPVTQRSTRRSRDELDAAAICLALLRARDQHRPGLHLVGLRRDQPHPQRRRLDDDIVSPPTQFISDVAAGTLAPSPGSRRTLRTPTIPATARRTVPAGWRAWSTPSVTASFGIRRAIFVLWDDWGGSLRSVAAAAARLRRPRHPRTADRRSRRMRWPASSDASRTRSTSSAASCAHRGNVRPAAACGERRRADAFGTDVFNFARRRERSSRSRRERDYRRPGNSRRSDPGRTSVDRLHGRARA